MGKLCLEKKLVNVSEPTDSLLGIPSLKQKKHWILCIWISLSTIFQLRLRILIFWTKFGQKGNFRCKTGKVNTTMEFCIFVLVYVASLTVNFEFLDQTCLEMVFPTQNRKSEHYHWILHIRISLQTLKKYVRQTLVFYVKYALGSRVFC